MKVVLSWLNELAPVGADADALAELMNDLGLAVDDVDPHRPAGRRRRSWRRCSRFDPIPTRSSPARRRRHGRRRAAPDLVRRVQHAGRRPRAARDCGHDDAERHEDRAAQDPRRVVERDALLARRARVRCRGGRHLHPPARPVARHAVVGGARRRRTTSCSTSTSPATDPTRYSHAGVARDLAARLGVPFDIARSRRSRSPGHRRVSP